jgi:hypothetical protein
MADVVAADVPKGTEVKWYGGGVVAQETVTVSAGQESGNYIALTKLAEYGSVWIEVNGVATGVFERGADGVTEATEANGTEGINYTGLKEDDVVDIYYVDIETIGLTHIASSKDIKTDTKASSKKEAVHGQSTKLVTVGVTESTATLEELMYTLDFVGLCLGDVLVNSPNSGWKKLSNKSSGFKKIGALVGKRSVDDVVVDKFFLIGATANSYGQTFPTEDMYKESFAFDCDYIQRARKTV